MTDSVVSASIQTHCLARFLIDLPDDFEPVGDVELIYGLDKDYRKVKVEALMEKEAAARFEITTSALGTVVVAGITRWHRWLWPRTWQGQ